MAKEETKKCKKCMEEINKKAKRCPKCGSKQGSPIFLIVIIAIIIVAIAGGASGSSDSDNSSNSGTNKKKEKLSLVEHNISDDSNEFAMYIEGKIKNNTEKEYSYVQVTFKTYDKDGNNLGSCLDNSSALDANGVWKFKAICTESVEEIDKYELDEISGW